MRILWTLVKVVIGLAIGIPLAIIALVLSLGVFGALLGIAILALKLAFFALCAYGAWRLLAHLFGSSPTPQRPTIKELPTADPYYEAARRELDRELGEVPRR